MIYSAALADRSVAPFNSASFYKHNTLWKQKHTFCLMHPTQNALCMLAFSIKTLSCKKQPVYNKCIQQIKVKKACITLIYISLKVGFFS